LGDALGDAAGDALRLLPSTVIDELLHLIIDQSGQILDTSGATLLVYIRIYIPPSVTPA
jgi:hypothetical protein